MSSQWSERVAVEGDIYALSHFKGQHSAGRRSE
jgi:hypothetical protein